MNFDTNRISKMIKESSNGVGSRSNVNIVESRKVGNRTFGLIKEYGNYVIKYTNKPENVIEEDFKYIKGEQNRHRFMRSNLKEAQNFFNLFVSEQHINPFISEDDDKYVIKKEVEDQPEVEPDIDMDVDSADVDMDMEDETADEIEADLEEYQELTGKLAYILGQVEDDQKDDVTKYIFNSLIAAMPSVGDEVSSSIKQKIEDKLEGTGDEESEMNQEDDASSMEESLKKKGFVVKESMSKQEALAFLGAADKSGIFKEKPTRFYDGQTKEPHMNKGVHKKGKSTPYGEKKDEKDKNKPFTKKAKKKVNEEKTVKKRTKIKIPTSASGYSISDIGKMQDAGEHDTVANLIINGALKKHTKGFMPDLIVNSIDFLVLKLTLKSMSKKKVPAIDIFKHALKEIKPIITSKGYKVIKGKNQMNELWEDIDENREKFNIGGELHPELENREELKRDAFRDLKREPEYDENLEAHKYFMQTGRWPWQEKDELEEDYELSLRQRAEDALNRGAKYQVRRMVADQFGEDSITPEVQNEINSIAANLEKYTFVEDGKMTGQFLQRAQKMIDRKIAPMIQDDEEMSIEDMLSDEYLRMDSDETHHDNLNEDENDMFHRHWNKEISSVLKSQIIDIEHYGYDVIDSNYTIEAPSEDSVYYNLSFIISPTKNKTNYAIESDMERLVGNDYNGPGQPYHDSSIESIKKKADNRYLVKISGRKGYDI